MGVHILWISSSFVLCSDINASTQQVLLLRILSFLCWMPRKICRCFLKSQYGWRQDSSAVVFCSTDCVLSSLFLLRSSVVEVREAVGAMAWMLWALWSNCINNLWTLTSVALWSEFESDPSVWCTRELVLNSYAVCGVMLLVGLRFHLIVCIENGEMLSSWPRTCCIL